MISSDFQLRKQRGRTSGGIFSPFLPSWASRIPHFVSVMFAWVLGPSSPDPPLTPRLPAPHGLPTPVANRKAFSAVSPPACFPKQTSSLERYSFDTPSGLVLKNAAAFIMKRQLLVWKNLWARISCSWGLCWHCSLSSSVEGYFIRDGTFLMVSATWLSCLAILKILYTKDPEVLWRY